VYNPTGPVTRILLIVAALGGATIACVVGAVQGAPAWVSALIAVGVGASVLFQLPVIGEAHVSIEPRTREVVLSRVRWPFRSVVRTFPFARVTDAVVRVDDDPNADATRYMVFLVVEGEAPVPLMKGLWVPGRVGCDKAAAQVRALLGK
jgi:hypothetical protein